MKETVLDILIYLFENYFDADLETTAEPDRETLKDELERAGFAALEVDRAIEWLEGLAAGPMQRTNAPTSRAIRVFNSREQSLLDIECRGYVLYLENIGILNAEQREVVIDSGRCVGFHRFCGHFLAAGFGRGGFGQEVSPDSRIVEYRWCVNCTIIYRQGLIWLATLRIRISPQRRDCFD